MSVEREKKIFLLVDWQTADFFFFFVFHLNNKKKKFCLRSIRDSKPEAWNLFIWIKKMRWTKKSEKKMKLK